MCVIQLTRQPVQVQTAQVLQAGTLAEKRRTRTPLAQCTASMASISAGVNISIIMMLYLARTRPMQCVRLAVYSAARVPMKAVVCAGSRQVARCIIVRKQATTHDKSPELMTR